ncbi:hypothetical protein [Shewanella acanthi]|uniref:hypothetical protein n=1 Tax=Shewanella acanthi TaxID=2864212 RepID=UPI001C65E18B|nr:hypothetical protein [Shewanella acanthi]QYJ79406.1 hypothetical protein K0H61_02865 [Shewanella acanthi]
MGFEIVFWVWAFTAIFYLIVYGWQKLDTWLGRESKNRETNHNHRHEAAIKHEDMLLGIEGSDVVDVNDLVILNKGAPFEFVFSNVDLKVANFIRQVLVDAPFYDEHEGAYRSVYILCYLFIIEKVKCTTFDLFLNEAQSELLDFQELKTDLNVYEFLKNKKICLEMFNLPNLKIEDKELEKVADFIRTPNFIEDCYYLKFLMDRYKFNGVHVVDDKDDVYYDKWHRAVRDGFALRGDDISLTKLVEMLRVKDINEMFEDVITQKLHRVKKAHDFAINHPEFKERLFKKWPCENLFCLNLENGKVLQDYYDFNIIKSKLIINTYFIAERNLQRFSYNSRNKLGIDICDSCKSKNIKTITLTSIKTAPPYYIGCSCRLN